MNGLKSVGSNKRGIFTPLVIMLLAIMFMVEFVKGAIIVSILPVYMQTALGISTFLIGWTLAVQYIGDNVFRSPIGWLIDQIGFRLIMIAGAFVTLLSIVILVTFSHFLWIMLACALLGIGSSPLWPCVITAATGSVGEQASGKIMSVIYMSWLTGVGLGPIVINFFLSDTYTTAFRILLVMMLFTVVLSIFLPGRHAKGTIGPAIQSVMKRLQQRRERGWDLSGKLKGMRRYLEEANRSLQIRWVFYPALFAQTFALGLLTPVLTLYARTVLHLTPAQYSYFLIAGGAITVIALLPVGKLVDRWGPRWFIRAGLLVSSLTLLSFTFAKAIPVVLGLVTLIGVGYALLIPSWNALIASVVPKEKRGAIWGFFLTIEGSGNVVGPIVSGKLWDTIGHQAPFIASGIVLAVMFVLQLFIFSGKKVVVR